MDELIARLVADIGIDRSAAEKAVGIILDFLVKEGPADKVQPLLAKLPGAEALIQKTAAEGGGGLTQLWRRVAERYLVRVPPTLSTSAEV